MSCSIRLIIACVVAKSSAAPEFQQRYQAELASKPDAVQPIREAARQGNVTLLYSAQDTKHNNAVALLAYL